MKAKILNASKMAKEYYIRFSEEEYMDIPPAFRSRATFVDNDYDTYKDDERFKALYKDYKKAKKALEDYKFDLRNK
jgi:hypothetical protein